MSASHEYAGVAAWKFKLKAEIHSYDDAAVFMREHGSDGFAELGPHMTVIYEGHDADPDQGARTYAVELYSTKIIRYYPDGTFSVDSGGFNTPTTRERLNAVLPARYGSASGGNGAAYFRRKQLGVGGLWPLDHSVRISAETGEVVS
jgi:hypothetical protein